MSSERKNSRLPPPAFPPGTRRKVHRNSTGPRKTPADADVGGEMFISPDDPMPPRADKLANAFISPDDPIPPRGDSFPAGYFSTDESLEDMDGMEGYDEDDEGVVTGIGLDEHLDPAELVAGGDPHVMEVVLAVGKLADALRRKGEAGLRTSFEMSRFEATLRAYCVGYIAGRRAEDEADESEVLGSVRPKGELPEL